MSLNKVVEDILRRGEERKREMVRLGEKERDEQISQADVKILEGRKREEKRLETLIAQMEQQEISSAELESKKALLAAQKQVMEELKECILHELEDYPSERRKKLYAKLVSRAKMELGECYVYTNARDKALIQLPTGMSYGGTVDCRGGLVFESNNRSYRLDYRFETMLEDVWNKNIREIYGKLFG